MQPLEVNTSAGGDATGKCSGCGGWVRTKRDGTVKAHLLARGDKAAA